MSTLSAPLARYDSPPPPWSPRPPLAHSGSFGIGSGRSAGANLRRTATAETVGTVLMQGLGDTVIIKKMQPPKRPLNGMETAVYYLMALFLPPLAVGLLKGGGTQMGFSLFLTGFGWVPGMVHAATLVHDQNLPKIVYRRVPVSQIGILSALQGYEFSEVEGGDAASLYEREYLPVLTKAGERW